MDTSGTKSPDPSLFFRPLCISLAIVAAISVSLISYHIILVRYCARRHRRMANTQSNPILQRSDQAVLGVEEHVLNTIPVILFSKNFSNLADLDQNECVICLGEFKDGEKGRSLPNCGHLFHVPCIDDWLSAHTNCPICRTPIIIPSSSRIDVSSALVESADERREISAQNVVRGEAEGTTGSNSDEGDISCRESVRENASSTLPTSLVCRQSVSFILPREKPPSSGMLKRSLSMDQCFIIIDLQGRDNDVENKISITSASHSESPSSSSSSSSSLSSTSSSSNNYLKEFLTNYRSYYKGRTTRQQIDHVSSRLLRSFSQMRSMADKSVLPC